MDLKHLIVFGRKNNKSYRNIVLISMFLVIKNAKNRKKTVRKELQSHRRMILHCKKQPHLMETNGGREFVTRVFTNFLSKINIKGYRR